MHTHDE